MQRIRAWSRGVGVGAAAEPWLLRGKFEEGLWRQKQGQAVNMEEFAGLVTYLGRFAARC